MDPFLAGFQKIAQGQGIFRSLGRLSAEVGATAGRATKASGKAVQRLGEIMEKRPGLVVPGALGLVAAHKVLSEPSGSQVGSTYYYPGGIYA